MYFIERLMVGTKKLKRNLYVAKIFIKKGKRVDFTTKGSKIKSIFGISPTAIRQEIKRKYSKK